MVDAQILVRHNIDLKTFREEIVPAAMPVVLKELEHVATSLPRHSTSPDDPRHL
jgi:hypothetical protein